PHRTNDIVHGDFHQLNILVLDSQVSGVIDWDAPHAGDCVFDLVTLLFYHYDDVEMHQQLWEAALGRASIELLGIYFAHMIVRQVDWSLRYHNQRTIDRFLSISSTVLDELAEHSGRPRQR